MDKENLIKKVDILLLTGKLLLQYGAETDVVDKYVYMMADKLDCKKNVELLVLPYTVIVTISKNNEVFTKIERGDRLEVNFTVVDAVIEMCKSIDKNSINLDDLHHKLYNILDTTKNYSVFMKSCMSGLGCGALSQILGGEFLIFIATFIASFCGYYLNSVLLKKMFNPFLVLILVSFVTSIIAGLLSFHSDNNHYAIAAAILMLIPSIAFINSVSDMVKRHYTNGLARGVRGLMVSIAIAIGVIIALNILGIERFL